MPGYEVKHERIAIDGVPDLFIQSLLDRQQFADPHGDAERMGISSATWPIFGLLWPSGARLAARMAQHPVAPGERILEMGCGLALASLVAHRRGADVTASDCHPLTEHFLQENLRLNQLGPMKYRHGHWSSDERPTDRDGMPASRMIDGRYDLLIGSDLLYDRDASQHLTHFAELHASGDSEIWIIDPDRGNRPAFNREMGLLGFERHEERMDGEGYKGRLLRYRRRDFAGLSAAS